MGRSPWTAADAPSASRDRRKPWKRALSLGKLCGIGLSACRGCPPCGVRIPQRPPFRRDARAAQRAVHAGPSRPPCAWSCPRRCSASRRFASGTNVSYRRVGHGPSPCFTEVVGKHGTHYRTLYGTRRRDAVWRKYPSRGVPDHSVNGLRYGIRAYATSRTGRRLGRECPAQLLGWRECRARGRLSPAPASCHNRRSRVSGRLL